MNLCPEQYDAIEIQAVRMEIGHDGKTICFPCRPDEADLWSIYAHLKEGGVEWLCDRETKVHALAGGYALATMWRLPVYDLTRQ